MNEAIEKILEERGIDPEMVVPNGQTAREYLEGMILGALDEIEDSMD